MPKRKISDEDKWRKKLKKYEKKLKKSQRSFEGDRDSISPSNSSPSPQRDRSFSRETSSERAASCHAARADTPAPLGGLDTEAPPVPLSEHESAIVQTTPQNDGNDDLTVATIPMADPELLQVLGIMETDNDEWGPDIVEDLAKRWEPLLKDGLKKETKDELNKKYPFPKNCTLMKPPILNPEISTVLNESAKNRDIRLGKKQAQLGCAFTILGRTMSDILTKSISTPDVLKNLSDLAKVLADAHFSETETRRSLIIPMVDKAFIEPFKDRKRDSHLFGEKLGEFIKRSRGIQKTGKLIQPTAASSSSTLNSKGPASRYQQQRLPRQAYRASETRASQHQQYRRRVPFQPAMNNRAPLPPSHSGPAAATVAPPNRKTTATTGYKRKQ